MLEIERNQSDLVGANSCRKMPMDFAAYLLSSSPPAFEFYSMREHYSLNDVSSRRPAVDLSGGYAPIRSIISLKSASAPDLKKLGKEPVQTKPRRNSLDDTVCHNVPKGKMGKKKVSFADDLGLALENVRIMTEPSDTPPRLRPEILSTLTQGALAGVTEQPPLVLNFSQPASDYLAFREKLEKNCVSLENVILRDYNLLGTIKVKNISFEKSVKVRVTFDGWESHTDIAANYVINTSGPDTCSPFDTFSFEINVPPNMDVKKTVQFAVSYEAGSQQFWDSNNGANYEVVTADWKEASKTEISGSTNIFSVGFDRSNWAQYSNWSNLDSSVPYW